jgi:hypothetical protein
VVNTALVSVKVTTVPPAGAACVKVTVHVADAFPPKLAGLQLTDVTFTGTVNPTLAVAVPLYVAVSVAV